MLNQEIIFSDNLDELLARLDDKNACALIIYCLEGRLQIEIDGQPHLIAPYDLLLCRTELIIGNYMRSPDLRCSVIAIRRNALDDIFYLCVRDVDKWWEKSFFLFQHPIIHLNERQQEITKLFNRLFQLYQDDTRSELSESIRRIFVQAAVLELLNWLEVNVEHSKEEKSRIGRQEVLFRHFCRLLQENRGRQREVRWYADQLAISPKYLSEICNNFAKKPALAVIHNATLQEIKCLLRQTDMSVKEISVQLNFPSLSFFCKYIKKYLGKTARQYRLSISRG